ncbi:helicase-related protein [Streptomyces caniscabiei]|uniref:DEAD/DEAH box helicase n=1 Tax=Streptomyces caniscabiei TaxID=2746961 RepID=A0A927LCD1_9ACTN|nr:helicase-related protein [Streptomyces caniscabiei]MBD9729169.1 DEAD/DEAH box helicase [Streptomyces caniscabiei]MDX3514582.1 helicase-related protein [Streptomyces caniscabiei]MDX3723858.1 helicase-related protein [Streptomyces caniscabiei]WEO23909.1 helicase-related protein [Streptomyces caniscabiei]
MDLVPALEEPLKNTLGAATAKVMAEHLGLHTVGDLLHHYPRRYEERGQLTHLADLPMDEHVTVVAQVADARLHTFASAKAPRGKGQRLEVTITDGSGRLQLVFFGNGVHKPHKDLLPGTRALFAGKVSVFNRRLQLAHPAYELLRGEDDTETVDTWAGALIPIYPATAKLESWKIAKAVQTVLPSAQEALDPLPESLREGRGLLSLPDALLKIHRPQTKADRDNARDRLKWDEAFVLQVALARRRHADAQLPAVARRPAPEGLLTAFDARLPFTLTDGQQKVSKEIFDDLATEHPMHRLLQGEVGSGKAQPLDSLVLTPAGFRRMGEMRVGDEVVVPDGEIALIDGVFPQGVRDVWRLVLSDGSSVECDDEHLWIVGTSCGWHRGQAPKVMTTREIRLDTFKANGSSKWYIPAAAPADLGGDSGLPLDPYLFGLLLGDGSFRRNLRLSTIDDEIRDAVAAAVAPECRLVPVKGSRRDYTIQLSRRVGGLRNPVIQTLRDLNLWGETSHGKFVPDEFKNTSVKNRLALLQGLLDTDGTVRADGMSVSLCTASRRLADDVAWLVRSLGGRARVLPKQAAFDVSVALPDEYTPFRLTRKADRVRPRPKHNTFRRGIRAVEHVGRKPVQCISVAHPSHAYVTDNFTVTHNTMVALRAMLAVVDAGGQAAMLAPTEVLAQQHHRSVTEMMGELAEGGMLGGAEHATKVVLLTGSMGAAGRRQALLDLVTGEAGIVIGTHALIEDKVQFHDLGLVVVDEQHRFGVEQRDALRGKGKQPPHLLVMTATPIPRTVAMTVFGDLETSVLDQLPAGRSPIASHVVPAADKPHFLARAWERVREEVANGHQAYVVCPRIGDDIDEPGDAKKAKKSPEDEAEKRPPLAVLDVAAQLAKGPLQGLRVEVLHGRMHPDDKDAVMRRFAAGETQVLVATTVIEVGVNVPNATAMVIMDADRFGVSQLHQLRGRVGRGSAAGLCLLVTEMPEASPARQRLGAVASTLDGFELSRIDLEQRREGDVLGQAQSGARTSLRMLTVIDDEEIIAEAREEAAAVVAADPDLEHLPALRTALDALLDEEREQYLDKG